MFHRKLLEILSRLSSDERKNFRLLLESPYFTRGLRNTKMVLDLYDYILKCNADEQHPKLAKALVFRYFFPDRTFQENEKGPLDTLASDLFRMLRRFMAQHAWESGENTYAEPFALLRFYRKYGLDDRFEQILQGLRKELKDNPFRDAEYYKAQFILEEEVSNFKTLSNTFEDDGNLLAVHQNLDTYYSILKLENTCALEYQRISSHFDKPVDASMIQAVLQWLEQNAVVNVPLNELYTQVLVQLKNPDNDHLLTQFEQSLDQYKAKIPLNKYQDLKAYYRFFWVRRYFKFGDDNARRRMFEIYREQFEQGYFHVDGNILFQSLRTLINFALKQGQFEWAKKVLDETPPERITGTKFPSEVHSLNLGEYYFYKKEYEQAQNRLTYKPFENPNLSLLADILLIKIYFETENELLDSRMKAMEQRIRRTKLSADNKERYFNFLKKLDKVIKYSWQKDSPKRRQLIEDIRTVPNIVEREWLLEKAGFVPAPA